MRKKTNENMSNIASAKTKVNLQNDNGRVKRMNEKNRKR
jgi:hypothetical protein